MNSRGFIKSRQPWQDVSRLFAVVVGVVAIAALYLARVAFIPLALAILFSFVFAPAVQLVERARLGRAFSTILVVLVAFVALGGVGWTVTKQFADVVNQLPNYRTNIREKVDSLHWSKSQTLDNASATMNEIGKELAAAPPSPKSGGTSSKPSGESSSPASRRSPLPVEVVQPPSLPFESVQDVLGLLMSGLIVVVFTVFILIRREDLRNRFISLVAHDQFSLVTHALDEAGNRVSRYLRMQFVVNASYAVVIGGALHFIGVPGAFLWGVIVGVFRFLPYIGPPMGAIMPLVLSLAVFQGWARPSLVLGTFIIGELLVSNFIEPVLYGTHTGISSMAILVSALFWTVLWGPIGLVLSTPLTVCLVVIGKHVPHLSFLQVLLGDEPALSPEAHVYQRLIAMDQEEAKEVLESYLKKQSLEQLYDDILVPTLILAQQDRYKGNLDESAAKLIGQSTNELVEELCEECRSESNSRGFDSTAEKLPASNEEQPKHTLRIVCIPARYDADEIVATMLVQVLERAGYQASCVPLGTPAEMIDTLNRREPDVVCISALPPFAIANARALYVAVVAERKADAIFVGLWGHSGDIDSASRRLISSETRKPCRTLSQVVQEIHVSSSGILTKSPAMS